MDDEKVNADSKSGLSGLLVFLNWLRELPRWAAIVSGAIVAIPPLYILVNGWLNAPRPETLRAPFDVSRNYHPEGFMGDGEICTTCVEINEAFRGKPRSGTLNGLSIRISYTKPAGKGFAGIYWLAPNSNWGENPGRRVVGATRVSFWAAGENGGEVVEFKAGGITKSRSNKFFDSFEADRGKLVLEKEWRRYEIDLRDTSLAEVIGAFEWNAADNWNKPPLIFYLSDIRYE
jgi:hypothetical protein